MHIVIRALEILGQCLASSIEMPALFAKAIHEAAKHNQHKVMKYLLERGPPLEVTSLYDTYNMACDLGYGEALQCLIETTSFNYLQPELLKTRFEKAVTNGHAGLVHLFLKDYWDHLSLFKCGEAFVIASGNGFVEVVRLMVKAMTKSLLDHNTLNQTLNVACLNGHEEVVQLLIQEGADVNAIVYEIPNQRDETLCFPGVADSASLKQHRSALQAALHGFTMSSEASANATIFLILRGKWRMANLTAHEQTILFLLKSGANVNEFSGNVTYPLYTATKYCSEEVVRLFIEKGAILDKIAPNGHTIIETAARRERGSASILRLLLRAGIVVPQCTAGINPILNLVLHHFGGSIPWTRGFDQYYFSQDGSFLQSNNIKEVLESGPGAAVQFLLRHLPTEKADDERYGLLLQMAIMARDRECIVLLIERQINVNAVGFYYGNALQAAARIGDLGLIQLLLSAGADVNVLCGKHDTAIRAAVLGGHESIVNVLANNGADVNLCLNRKEDPPKSILYLALEVGNLAIFRLLITAGTKVNINPAQQLQLMIAACRSGDCAIIQLLLDRDADVNNEKENCNIAWDGEAGALHMACAKGHKSLARLLLKSGAEVEKDLGKSGTPLQLAAYNGHVSLVILLVEVGAKVNHSNPNGTALSIASTRGHLGVVQELLSAGASIFDSPHVPNALAAACRRGHLSVVRFLVETLSDVDHEGLACADALPAASQDDQMLCLLLASGTPKSLSILYQVCAAGHERSASMLLESGVAINGDDGDGFHALYIAAYYQQLGIVQKLLDSGADANFPSKGHGSSLQAALIGFTPNIKLPLSKALRDSVRPRCPISSDSEIHGPRYEHCDITKCEEIVRILIKHGADVNTDMGVFGNAMHLACFIGSESTVQLLLDKGTSIHASSDYFETALFAALEHECPAIVEFLLAGGINVNRISTKHGTPLHDACTKRSRNIVDMLLKYGADINIVGGPHGSTLTATLSRNTIPDPFKLEEHRQEKRAILELLLNFRDKVQIRECDLIAGASSGRGYCGARERYLDTFFEYDQAVQATEHVIVAVIEQAERIDLEALRMLLERSGGMGVTEAMLKAVRTIPVMQILLDHRPICHISKEILDGAYQNGRDGRNLRQLLLTHTADTDNQELPHPIPASEDVDMRRNSKRRRVR